jgi:hypothetical protein
MVMRKNDLEDEDDEVIADGGSVRVPVMLCDARFQLGDDEMRKIRAATRDARDEYLVGLQSAWRSPAPDRGKQSAASAAVADCDPVRGRTAAYDEMVQRACNAWKTPARDFAQPDLSTPPEELALRRHLSTESNADIQAKRDRIYKNYVDTLQNAWRTPIVGAGPGAIGASPRTAGPGPSSPPEDRSSWRNRLAHA